MSTPDSWTSTDTSYPGEAGSDSRRETPNERLDRNWNALLQELRVIQTGSQLVAGFLLTLPFQEPFQDLDRYQVTVYLILVCAAALTIALGLGPVSLHRMLFRKGAMAQVVKVGNRLVRATLAGVAAVLTGTTLLIFDVVVGRAAGLVAAATVLAVTVVIWLVVPRLVKPSEA